MSSSLGRVTAHLAEPTDSLPPEMVALINQNIKPPTPVTADEVYVRAMYIVSDQVNSFGGRFPVDEHRRLAELLVDSPVMVGHRKDKLPVGRSFHAEPVERDGHPWVKCYFYWLRSSDGAEQLRDNIDGGIYKECSIAFTFNFPACSICGRDIRRCEHEPFETYTRDGADAVCHFDYHEIERVLETSLVYRGAIPDTSISKTLDTNANVSYPKLSLLDSIDSLDPDGSYLIVPRYDGLPLTACSRDGALSLTRLGGLPLAADLSHDCRSVAFRPSEPMFGMLVGYRGRERCTRQQLERYLEDRTGPVSRLVLHVYPHQGLLTLPRVTKGARLQVRIMPHRIVLFDNLERKAREITTRDGVEIWPLSSTTDNVLAYEYHPGSSLSGARPHYRLETHPDSNTAILSIFENESKSRATQTFELISFDLDLMRRGRRFAARSVNQPQLSFKTRPSVVLEEDILSTERRDGSLVVTCADESGRQLTLRPIRLGGRDLFLFSMLSGPANLGRSVTEVTGV